MTDEGRMPLGQETGASGGGWRRWGRLLVSAALLGWIGWRTDWPQVGRAFAHLHFELWLAAAGLYALTQVVSGLRWQMLARPLGFDQPLGRYVRFYFLGMYFNLVLPTSIGGDVVRALYLAAGQEGSAPPAGRRLAAFLSVFADRFSGLLVLLTLACTAVAFCPVDLPRWIPVSVWGTAGCAALGLAALPLLMRSDGLRRRLGQRAGDVTRVWTYVARPGPVLLSLVVQAANVVLVWWVGLALDAPVPAAYYWVLVPMVTLLTLLPVSVNGMGVREGGTALFLLPLGVPESTALSLAFLWFCVFTTVSLAGGALYLMGGARTVAARARNVNGSGNGNGNGNEERSAYEPVGGDSDQGRARQPRAAA